MPVDPAGTPNGITKLFKTPSHGVVLGAQGLSPIFSKPQHLDKGTCLKQDIQEAFYCHDLSKPTQTNKGGINIEYWRKPKQCNDPSQQHKRKQH